MNKEEFINELKNIGIELTNEQINKLEIYKEFLKKYNEHTNLTAITSDEEIYLKHFFDSLMITKVVDLTKENSLLDIGTGAGFPGMVLKIVYPNLDIVLLDSNNKKIKFLEELKKKLNLEITLINDRCENYAKNNLNKFDIVTSRAVANLRVLSELAIPLVKENGLFIPLKGNLNENLEDAKETLEVLNTKIVEQNKFELYKNTGIRNILVIKKLGMTKLEDLRPYDKIIKKPLQKNHK